MLNLIKNLVRMTTAQGMNPAPSTLAIRPWPSSPIRPGRADRGPAIAKPTVPEHSGLTPQGGDPRRPSVPA